jgi:energy-coupling factor transport system ATP-binding protein
VPDPALVVEDYSFWYKVGPNQRALALEDVSFQIDKGEFVLILGASGSGKSTLALNLVGIYPDYFGGWNEGRILVNAPGKGLVNRRELSRGERFKCVNMLFQNPEDQIVTLTVEEEIAFALENYLVPSTDIPARIDRALDLVGLGGFKHRSTLKLSGGEKQRVALAAMLAMEPSILILDEPTSNLDPVGTEEVLDSVARIRSHIDITMMIVEHQVDDVFHQVDRALLVHDKKVYGPEPPREFMARHGLEVRDEMGLWITQASEVGLQLERDGIRLSSVPLTGPELVREVNALSSQGPGEGQRSVTGPRAEASGRSARRRVLGVNVIRVKDVDFSYPTQPDVLRKVNLDIRSHELLAIVGQNGSGKSTLAAMLNGILTPSSGRVLVDGRPTNKYKFAELCKRVAYIFQTPEKQFIRNTVVDEMGHGVKALKLPPAEIDQRVEAFLDTVRLTDRKDASPYALSHGQKRRLSVACMIIAEPEVVILDEPTFGQDWEQAKRLMEVMRELADGGAAVTFITHDMRLVAGYADRCAVMSGGAVIFDGTPHELFADPEVLRRSHLKPPPVWDFSQELLGEPVLDTEELVERIKEGRVGRPRTFV